MEHDKDRKKRRRFLKRAVFSVSFSFLTAMLFSAHGGERQAQAYFLSVNTVQNEMTGGSVKAEIEEIFSPPKELDPGASIEKRVAVRNTGSVSCYVRIRVLYPKENCTIVFNETDYSPGADGFWYLTNALQAGEVSRPLFTEVRLNAEAQASGGFDVIVYEEAYQAGNYETYQEAWSDFTTER